MGPLEAKMIESAKDTRARLCGSQRQLEVLVVELTRQLKVARKEIERLKPKDIDAEIDRIIAMVARGEGVKVSDLTSQRRTANLIQPRHICYYLAINAAGSSYPMVARHFNKKCHSTVMYGVKKIGTRLAIDSDLHNKVVYYSSLM